MCFCNYGNVFRIYFSLNIHIQHVTIMFQIPEGLQMGSLYAVGEHSIPAGIEFIFDTSVLPICHPSGALAGLPM